MNPTSPSFMPARCFSAGIFLYFLLHLLIRVGFSDSLELDEAEQWLFAQWLDWGYSSQPPLYTWLLKAFFSVLGESIFTLALVKNLCLLVLYAATFRLALQVLGDDKRAVLAALSLLLMPPVAWEASRDLTHTILVACWVPVSFLIVLQLLERPVTRGYVMLGGVIGLGFLSKYNFSLHCLALLLSLMSLPQGRRLLLDKRVFLSLLLAGLLYAPQGFWMLEHQAALSRGLVKLGLTDRHNPAFLGKLGLAVAAYTAPLVLMAALIWGVRQPARQNPPTKSLAVRVLERYFLSLSLVLLLGVWFIEGGHLKTRWLFPFMAVFPVWLFARIPVAYLTPMRTRAYLASIGGTAGLILLLMLFRVPGASLTQKPTDLNLPFAAVAHDLRQAGFQQGLIVAANPHMGGNLRYQFREQVQVITPHLGFHLPGKLKGQPVLLFWEAEKEARMPSLLREFARNELQLDVDAIEPRYLLHPYRYSDHLISKMAYVSVKPGS